MEEDVSTDSSFSGLLANKYGKILSAQEASSLVPLASIQVWKNSNTGNSNLEEDAITDSSFSGLLADKYGKKLSAQVAASLVS